MTRTLGWVQDILLGLLLFLAPIKLTTMVLGGEGVLAKQGLLISFALVGLAAIAWLAAQFLPQEKVPEREPKGRRRNKHRAPDPALPAPAERMRFPRTGLGLPAVTLLALMVISTAVASVSLDASLRELLRVAIGLALFWLIVSRPASSGRLKWYAGALAAGAGLVSIWGLNEFAWAYAAGVTTWRIFGQLQIGSLQIGGFQNPNLLANYLIAVLPVACVLALVVRHRWQRLLWGGLALMMLAAFFFTGSRGGLLALAVAMVTLALALPLPFKLADRKGGLSRIVASRQSRAVLVILPLIVLSLGLPTLRVRLLTTFSRQQHSNMFRYLTWQGTADLIAAHPLWGNGPASFEYVYPKYARAGFVRLAHQNLLQVAADAGIPAGIAFAWLQLAALLVAARGLRSGSFERQALAAASLAGLAGFVSHGMFDSVWVNQANGLAFWALAGLGVLCGEELREKRWREAPLPGAVGRIALLAGASVAFLLVLRVTVNWTVADILRQRADQAVTDGDFDTAVELAERAVRMDSLEAAHYRMLTRALAYQRSDPLPPAREAIRLEPTNARNYLLYARAAGLLHRYDLEAQAYRSAVSRDPHAVIALKELAQLYQSNGQPGRALPVWHRLIAVEKSDFGRYPAVAEYVETAYAFAHYEVARSLLRRSSGPNFEEAEANLRQVAAIMDKWENTEDLVAKAMTAFRGYTESEKVSEIKQLEAKTLYRLAKLAEHYRKQKDAQELYDRAHRIYPGVWVLIEQEDRLG